MMNELNLPDDLEITDMEDFFSEADLPETPIQLDVCTIIQSPKAFVHAHIEHLRANVGKFNSTPYYERLLKLRLIIEQFRNISKV